MSAARTQVAEWLALPPVFTPKPTHRHPEILDVLLAEADRDFARFGGLKWENPIAG